jgi:[acyl-carrier-protein] S-malonyltransferase
LAGIVARVVSVAFVFPGQGSQYVGMGRALFDLSPAAAEVFATADEALADPISKLTFDGSEEDLNLTVNAQPAIRG